MLTLGGQLSGAVAANRPGQVSGTLSGTHVQPGSESTSCTTINSNSSLANSYTGFYNSLANDSPNWGGGGPNSSIPVNQSGYRNATAGGEMVIEAWISICSSSAYTSLYDQWGPSSVTGGGELLANGHYEFTYGIYFHASCTNPVDSSNDDCGYETDWNLDLVTGVVTGPTTTNEGPPLGGPPPSQPYPANPTTSSAPSPKTPTQSPWWTPLTPERAGVLGAVLAGGALLAYLLVRRRPPPARSTATPATVPKTDTPPTGE